MPQTDGRVDGTGTGTDALELDRACSRLAEREEWRGLVRVIERWSESADPMFGDPTPAALQLQARAFLELCLMDRAWVRLKEVAEVDADSLEVQALTAEMYIRRGWPVRARKIVARCLEREPDSARFQALQTQANAPPIQPQGNAREIENSGTPAQQLDLAERFMAAGSFLRARSILERLRRRRGPDRPRVELLLWALGGDFAREQGDPMELAGQLGALGAVDEASDDPSAMDTWNSEVTSAGVGRGEDGPDEDAGFPALFRRVEDPLAEGYTTEEVTAVSRVASEEELQQRLEEPDSEVEEVGIPNADTQIRMVINTANSASDGLERGHELKDEDGYKLHDTLNLREYLESVGMEHRMDDVSEEVDLEEEDEDLIVVTRRERTPVPESEAPTQERRPVEVVERALGMAEGLMKPIRPVDVLDDEATIGEAPPPIRPRDAVADDEDLVPLGGFNAGPRIALAGILLLLLFLVGLAAGAKLVGAFIGGRVVSDAIGAVQTGDYRVLQAMEARTQASVDSGARPIGAWQSAHALVELALWAEYTGDSQRLESGLAALSAAREVGAPGDGVALAEAYRAHHQGSDDVALAALKGVKGAEGYGLASRIAVMRGDGEGATALARAAVDTEPGKARYQLDLVAACRASGDVSCVDEALAAAAALSADDPWVELERIRGLPAKRQLGALNALAKRQDLPPRLLGTVHAMRGARLAAVGEDAAARAAIDRALSVDASSPTLQHVLGVRYIHEGQLGDALKSWTRAHQQRPGDFQLLHGLVFTLVEMDRVDEADAALASIPAGLRSHPDLPVLKARVLLHGKDDAKGALALLEGRLADAPNHAEAALLAGQAAKALDDPRARTFLRQAVARLPTDDNELIQYQHARALALLLGLEPDEDRAESLRAQALELGPRDPMVHIHIGEWHDLASRSAEARVRYDQAVQVGPEHARAWYLRGRFYGGPSDRKGRQRESWDHWLGLQPTGGRVDRVNGRLGRR